MKKNLLLGVLFLIVGEGMQADDYHYLIVQRNDANATKVDVGLTALQKITFDGTNMVVKGTDGVQSLYVLTTLDQMYFSSVTDVKAAKGKTSSEISIYTADGILLKSMVPSRAGAVSFITTQPKGVYILKAKERKEKLINQ